MFVNLLYYIQVLKRSVKAQQVCEPDDYGEKVCGGTVDLYGKWQTEPLTLPRAVDGIVPKVKFCILTFTLKHFINYKIYFPLH